jgi:3-mercaptopyruvate sulfurtransferase SseA
MAQKMIDKGYARVYALKGGWKTWEKSGNPVERK